MTTKHMFDEPVETTEAVIRVLEEAGIDTVFGMPGGHTGWLYKALANHQETIRTLMVREESLAAVMAEVRGRLTGVPGVLMGQGAWILGNGVIGTLEARLSSSPMILMGDFSDTTGFDLHASYQSGTGHYGSWNARKAFEGICKEVFEADNPISAVQATQLAIKHALTGQPGPVAVLFKGRSLEGIIEPVTRPQIYTTRSYLPGRLPPARQDDIIASSKLIAESRRPVIIAGNGVRVARAFNQLEAIAERGAIPVVTTNTGKGVLAETHPLSLGVFGTFGGPGANACVGEADLIIVVGSKLGAFDTARESKELLDPTRQVFIQIDVEPRNASWTYPSDYQLIGDAGEILDQLAVCLPERPKDEGIARVASYRSSHGYFGSEASRSEEIPIMPQRFITDLSNGLPDNAMIALDAGENRILMTYFYQTRGAGTFLQAAGAGPMGYAIPAAMAAKVTYPDRAAVAVCGDGGFAMTMNGLMSCREHNIPIIVCVMNNRSLGWVVHGAGRFAAEFDDIDHAAIARSIGCKGVRVTDPNDFLPALNEALASEIPTVIDVMTSMAVSFRDVTSSLFE